MNFASREVAPRATATSVAVLGAGLQGSLCALELADRGARVVLFDRAERAMAGASLRNEGKIHIGYVYAQDDLTRTARLMARGAVAFGAILSRWCSEAELTENMSDPFAYLVMRDSLVPADELARRYGRIGAFLCDEIAAAGTGYLGNMRPQPVERMPAAEVEARFNAEFAEAAFLTPERSVYLPGLAGLVRRAVDRHPRIELRLNSHVDAVWGSSRESWRVGPGSGADGPFDHVVNALWAERLRIDASVGLSVNRPFLMRRRIANHVRAAPVPGDPGSVSMVLGPYGDIVRYPDGSYYLSWYPTGCIDRTDSAVLPPDWLGEPDPETLADAFRRSVAELDRRVTGVAALVRRAESVSSKAGIVFA